MGWRDDLLPASFKGVSFFVTASDSPTGNRKSVIEIPYKKSPEILDTGPKPRIFNFPGFVAGKNYILDRNKFLDTLESDGPGELIHPSLGILWVHAIDYPYNEDFLKTGGVVTFALSFCLVDKYKKYSSQKTTASIIANKSSSALSMLRIYFAKAYDIIKMPKRLVDKTIGTINTALDVVEAGKDIVRSGTDFVDKINAAKSLTEILVRQPSALAQMVSDLVTYSTHTVDPRSIVDEIQRISDYINTIKEENNSSLYGKQDSANKTALKQLLYTSAVVNAAKQIAIANYESSNIGIYVHQSWSTHYEAVISMIDDAELYMSLNDLNVSIMDFFETTILNLPKVSAFVPNSTTNSLLLSYQIYGDVDHVDDIVKRNKIKYPAYIASREPLEVLVK